MRICVIDADLRQQNVRLQPQCYMHAVCHWLVEVGEEVLIMSDGYPSLPAEDSVGGLPVHRIGHVRFPPVVGNKSLSKVLPSYKPDIILWHLGLTSLLHLRFGSKMPAPVLGILTSPLYSTGEVATVGWGDLIRRFPSFLPHMVGALLPKPCPRWLLGTREFERLVVMTQTTRHRLARLGFPEEQIQVIPPGVDKVFLDLASQDHSKAEELRLRLGINRENFMVLFAGSPELYRGLSDILEALPLVLRQAPHTRLVVLSRITGNNSMSDQRTAQRLCHSLKLKGYVSFVTDLLSPETIVQYMYAADAVVLPFRLVASGIPITLLEALALGTSVIVTGVAGMEEFVSDKQGFVVPAHSPKALADALVTSAAQRHDKTKTLEAGSVIRSWSQVGQEIYRLMHSILEQSSV